MRNILICFTLALSFSPQAFAALSPLGISIVPGVQFPPEEYSVTGLRASVLWGNHRDLYGIDLGVLGNVTNNTFTGIGISGLFNVTHGMTTAIGAQLAGVVNMNTQKTNVYGLQLALGANVNTAESRVVGLELAAVNAAEFTQIDGFQIGIYNHAKEVYGFQIGVVNRTKSLHGLQIGLLNFNETGTFYVSTILNVGF